MRPAPSRITVRSSSAERRLPMPTSDGICGGAPSRSSRWHDAQLLQIELPAAARQPRSAPGRRSRPSRSRSRTAARSPDRTPTRPTPRRRRSRERRSSAVPTLERHELPVAAKRAELPRAPPCAPPACAFVSISSVRTLPRERRGLRRRAAASAAATSPSTVLAGTPALLDREQRRAVGAIEQEDVARAWSSARRRRRAGRCASPSPGSAATENRGPRCRAARPGNARCAGRSCASSASSELANRLSPSRLAP